MRDHLVRHEVNRTTMQMSNKTKEMHVGQDIMRNNATINSPSLTETNKYKEIL